MGWAGLGRWHGIPLSPQQGWLNWNVTRARAALVTRKTACLRRKSLKVDVSSHGEALTRSWWRQILQEFSELWSWAWVQPWRWNEGCGWGMTIRSDQSLSRVQLFATSWIAACQASLSITNSWSSPRLTSIESVMPSSHLILCRPLLLPPIPPSIRVFSNEPTLHMRWPKYWSFSFSIIPSKEHPGLISFRMNWLDLLSVQGALKSLLQHHSSKASILF